MAPLRWTPPLDAGNPWEWPNDPCEDGHLWPEQAELEAQGPGEVVHCLRGSCDATGTITPHHAIKETSR